MANENRRQQIIEKLKTMSNAELDRVINLMLRLREMPEAESRQLAETLKNRQKIVSVR